jgi:hypothetical protein
MIPNLIVGTACMLTAINFDDKALFTAGEIGEIGPNWKLADEFVSVQPATTKFGPKCIFRVVVSLSEGSRSLCPKNLGSAHNGLM